MKLREIIVLSGVSTLALAAALAAQEAAPKQIMLDPITLIADGRERVEATGGVAVNQQDIEALQPADVSELF